MGDDGGVDQFFVLFNRRWAYGSVWGIGGVVGVVEDGLFFHSGVLGGCDLMI